MMGADLGNFTIARWALRGRLRLPIEQLEYEMVSAVGFWLDEHRWNTRPEGSRPGLSAEEGSDAVLQAWYGPDRAAPMIEARRRHSWAWAWAWGDALGNLLTLLLP